MTRAFAIWLSRRFPPKHVTDRVLPWLTIALVLVGGIFAVYEHLKNSNAARVIETIRLHQAFVMQTPSGKSLQSLQNRLIDGLGPLIDQRRCEYVLELADKGEVQLQPNVQCNDAKSHSIIAAIELQGQQRDELRRRLSDVEEQIVQENEEAIQQLLGHYTTVIVCVKNAACNGESARDIYARDMIGFVNAFCSYFEKKGKEWKEPPADRLIAEFIVRYNLHRDATLMQESSRQKLFRCDGHRALES